MEELIELVRVVNPYHLSKLSILGDPKIATRINKLYLGLYDHPQMSETELASETLGLEADSKQFKQLKSDLKSRLINQIFLSEGISKKFSNYSQSNDTCLKLYTAAQILYSKGAKKASVELSEKAFRIADKFQFGTLGYLILINLRYAYYLLGNTKKIIWVKEKIKNYKVKFLKESEVEELYLLQSELEGKNKSIKARELFVEEKEVLKLMEGELTPKIILFGYNALYKAEILKSNYSKAIMYSKIAIQKFNKFNFLPEIFLLANYLNILNAAKMLFEFQKVDDVLDEIRSTLDRIKGDNTLVVEKGILDFAIITNNYKVGLNSLDRILNNKRLNKFKKSFGEELQLTVIYLFLLKQLNLIDDSEDQIPAPKIGKFLNSASEIKKDKTGYNTAFLILQTIYSIYRKDYEEVIESLRKLQTYTYRYLRKNQSYRAQCFIKMLQVLPGAHFHKKGAERKAKKWLKLLDQPSIANKQSRITNNEIVPFQMQWQFVLNCLDTKFKYGSWTNDF